MKRLLTAAVLIPFILYVVLLGPPRLFEGVVALVACVCFHEFCAIAKISRTPELLGLVSGLLLLFANPMQAALLLTIVGLVALTLSLRSVNLAAAFGEGAALVLGVVYLFLTWKTAIFLHDVSKWWLVFGLALNWIGDSGAYYFGRRFGKYKLAPSVSPGKSWEGAVASVVVSVIFGILFLPRTVPSVSWMAAAALALPVNIAGQLGDLAESAIKRGAGVKDSGTLLPGHGGLLDRVDSAIFALPVLWIIVSMMLRPA